MSPSLGPGQKPGNSRRHSETAAEEGMHFSGQAFRMNEQCPAKAAISWIQADGGRKRGRPKKSGTRDFREIWKTSALKGKDAETVAADRELWCNACSPICLRQDAKEKKRERDEDHGVVSNELFDWTFLGPAELSECLPSLLHTLRVVNRERRAAKTTQTDSPLHFFLPGRLTWYFVMAK